MKDFIISVCNHFHKHNFPTLEIDGKEYWCDEFMEILHSHDGSQSEGLKIYFQRLGEIQQEQKNIKNRKIRSVGGNFYI